jgi:copper resistance protein C
MAADRALRILAAAGLAGALLRPGGALAHAIVLEATPAVNQQVAGPDVAIRLRFNSRIDHKRSRLMLLDAAGEARPLAVAASDADDVLSAGASGLAPGSYRIRWQVLAVDGHITRGDVPFTITRP